MRPISSLKAHYLDDPKLAQLAWLEFARAMRTRRMVAFVGSMATEALGYPTWKRLQANYFEKARKLVEALTDPSGTRGESLANDQAWALRTINQFETGSGIASPVVAMSLIGEVLGSERLRPWQQGGPASPVSTQSAEWPLDATRSSLERLTAEFARDFRQPAGPLSVFGPGDKAQAHLKAIDVPELLFNHLDIRRFATTNYDFEIERKTMLRDRAKWKEEPAAILDSPFDQLRVIRDGLAHAPAGEVFDWDLGSGRIRRVLTHGKAAESDVLNRERIDRLIEFAIGTDDVDSHVMHLHGRACDWRSLIVTQRDYDRLYRSNDLNRLPFEFARRLMMGGNPMLFVGLGMSEADVVRDLHEFISNNRYHRTAPAFLLWSALAKAMTPSEKARMRLDLLHRLGVLTIFDTDFTPDARQIALGDAAILLRAAESDLPQEQQLELLALSVRQVAAQLDEPLREAHIAKAWRDATLPLDRDAPGAPSTLSILWQRQPDNPAANPTDGGDASDCGGLFDEAIVQRVLGETFLCVVGSSGCGKGNASLALARQLSVDNPCLLINGSFSFDTDSMLSGISGFFERFLSERLKRESRSQYFARLAKDVARRIADGRPPSHDGRRLFIILNGAERFFSINGEPLSGELDELMHLDIGGLTWVMFGTERVARHARDALHAKIERFEAFVRREQSAANDQEPPIPFSYMETVLGAVSSAIGEGDEAAGALSAGDWRVLRHEVASFRHASAGRISGNSQHLREAFFTWVLDGHILAALLGATKGATASRETVTLAQMILRYLCFFGLPIEFAVLSRIAALRNAAAAACKPEKISEETMLAETLRKLCERRLVLRLAAYRGYGNPQPKDDGHYRYGLHRALLTELRSRFAIPLSEAKLSTTFNMSLYVAQPVDGYLPEPAMHDELGGLMDALMGSYREVGLQPSQRLAEVVANNGLEEATFFDALAAAATAAQSSEQAQERRKPEALLRMHQLCRYDTIQRLRATLAVARGFYATTGILTLDNGDRFLRDDRDGILLEHAERLDRLIDIYAKTALARAELSSRFNAADWGPKFENIYGGAEPFYAEEIIWLHNERGVVRLAMGDLYEAQASFERAMAVNHDHVEYQGRDHNWRRIRLNQLTVATEMGDIGLARRMADEIVDVSRSAKPLLLGARSLAKRTANATAPGETAMVRPEGAADPLRSEPTLREDRLAVAIALGHLGWCSHLQGDSGRADRLYCDAIDRLAALEEVRAQAFFVRLRVDVGQVSDDPVANRARLEKALDLIQSTRQMDLIHRFQVTLANTYAADTDPAVQQRAYRILDDALQYSLLADVYRVRCEASMTIARLRHRTGDYEGALRFASDALMIATRYGMELRKITLRTDIARTMAARGHPVTAQKLAKTAVTVASRQRFHSAVRRAEQVLVEIPQISAAIRQSDSSGLRRF